MPLERFRELSLPWLEKAGLPVGGVTNDYLDHVLASVKEKIKLLKEVPPWSAYFFTEDFPFDEEAVNKDVARAGRRRASGAAGREAGTCPSGGLGADGLEAAFKELAAQQGVKTALYIHPARVAASGRSVGPSLYHMLAILGKEKVLARLRSAAVIDRLST